MFPLAGVINENFSKSDHRPIMVNTRYLENVEAARLARKKMFEAKWLLEESFDEIVSAAWESAHVHGPSDFATRVKKVHLALHAWDMQTLKEPRRCLKEL
jgi:hypothetical protein